MKAIEELLASSGIEPLVVGMDRPVDRRRPKFVQRLLGLVAIRQACNLLRLAQVLHHAGELGIGAVWLLSADAMMLRLSLVLPLLALWRKAPHLILTFHTSHWLTPKGRIRRVLTQLAARAVLRSGRVRSVVVYTDALQHILQRLGCQVISTLPYPTCGTMPTGRLQARILLGLPPDEVVVGFLGFIRPGKGFPTFLEALRVLRRRPFWLVVAGKPLSGGLGDGVGESGVGRELARLMGGHLSVSFLRLSDDAYDQYMRACDIIVLPYEARHYSEFASTSGVLYEALAAGCQVVVSDVSHFRSLVDQYRLGFVVKPDSPRHLAAGILRAVRRHRRGWRSDSEAVVRQIQDRWMVFLGTLGREASR